MGAEIGATDADGNTLTFARVNDALHGSATISSAGVLVYAPNANYAGADSFSVRVSDGAGGEVTGTINITVAAVNDAPAFANTAFVISEDTVLEGNLLPSDVDNTTLTVTRTSGPQHGQVTVSAAGLVNYLPSANYFGPDAFEVSVSDGAGGTTAATVTVNVTAVNDSPVLVTSALTVNEDNVLSIQLVSDDAEGQALSYVLEHSTLHGQVSVTRSGLLTYTPDPDYFGPDTLAVQVSDNPQEQTSWPITITVSSVNDVPVAVDDEFRIADGAPKTMAVVTNDSDIEAGAMSVSIVQQPAGGTVTVGASNVLTFTPANAFTGPISFTYRLTDSDGAHDDATVRALIGNFQSLVYLADDLTPGRQEIYLFDGLRSTRIVQAPVHDYEFITRFTVSDDGSKLLYVVAGPMYDEFYVKPINATGPGTKIWANSPLNPPNTSVGIPRLALNRTGSHALIEDRYSSANKRIYIVNTETLAADLLGGDEPQVILASIVLFNPQNPGQLVLQGQIGGTVPTNGTEYYSAFIANVTSPRDLTQIGANYPQLQGSGSGFGFWFGGAGRYIYHTEYQPFATPITKSLLLYDSTTQLESVVYRRPTGTEHGITNLPNTNADGSKIVFGFTEPNPTDGDGPAAFYASSPATPATVLRLSNYAYPRAGRILFTADGDTAIVQALDVASGQMELFAASTSPNPVATPLKIGKSLDPGETIARVFAARGVQRLIVGYRTSPAETTRLYNLSVYSMGTETPFTTTFPYFGAPGEDIDDLAQFVAYAPVEGSRRMLRILSTRAVDYSIPVMGAGSTGGVSQFRWLPRP
jgi:VCBS repeat-containing protein